MLKMLEPEANPGSGWLKKIVPRSNGSGCTTLGRYRLLSKSVVKHFFLSKHRQWDLLWTVQAADEFQSARKVSQLLRYHSGASSMSIPQWMKSSSPAEISCTRVEMVAGFLTADVLTAGVLPCYLTRMVLTASTWLVLRADTQLILTFDTCMILKADISWF